MGLQEYYGLRYFQFNIFDKKSIVHGLYTRHGGVSPSPWASLNLGGTVGDLRENVIENRRRIFQSVNREVESIYDVWQVHSADVNLAIKPRPLDSAPEKADAIITDRPEITLFMRFADCVPILFHDPVHRAVGIAHAGWKGTISKIVIHTIQAMVNQFNSNPEDILAGIGPSICSDHYEIGSDVETDARMAFGSDADEVLCAQDGKIHFDLWKANQILLYQAGVRKIEVSKICTRCHTEDWYSHRGELGNTGRYGALIVLNGRYGVN